MSAPRQILPVLLLLLSASITAQDKITRYGIVADQDLLAESFGLKNSNEDRNYTMGIGIFLTNNKWGNAMLFRPFKWMSDKTNFGLAAKTFGAAFEKEYSATLSLGVTGFTPRYLGNNLADSSYFIENDRPFASIVFLSTKYQVATRKKVETNQLVFGVLGLSLAQSVQTHIHKNHWLGSTREIPLGWEYQLSSGGKLTVLYANRADFLLNAAGSFNPARQGKMNSQFIFSREYRLGYYTDVSTGLAMKLGIIDPGSWASFDTYQLGFASSKKKSTDGRDIFVPKLKQKLRGEIFLLASLRPHYYLYNQFIQSSDTRLDYHYSINHFVVDGFAGLGATIPNAKNNFTSSILLYLSGRTREISSPISNRNHVWGGVQLAFTRIGPTGSK